MSEENVEIVRRVYDAVARRDAETVLALYDAEVEWDWTRVPGLFGQGGLYRGREGLRAWFREWSEGLEHIEYEAEELIATDDHVISKSDMRGRGRTSGSRSGRLCTRFGRSGTARSSGSHGSPAAPRRSKPPALRSRRCRKRTWRSCAGATTPFTGDADGALAHFDPDVVVDASRARPDGGKGQDAKSERDRHRLDGNLG